MNRERFCRIADDGCSRRDALRDDCAHADDSAAPDDNRPFAPIPDYCTGADIGMVFYDNSAIAHYSWSKSHEIADDAIMRNIRIDVAVKKTAYPRVGCDV